jgi:hypothetical protein
VTWAANGEGGGREMWETYPVSTGRGIPPANGGECQCVGNDGGGNDGGAVAAGDGIVEGQLAHVLPPPGQRRGEAGGRGGQTMQSAPWAGDALTISGTTEMKMPRKSMTARRREGEQ